MSLEKVTRNRLGTHAPLCARKYMNSFKYMIDRTIKVRTGSCILNSHQGRL